VKVLVVGGTGFLGYHAVLELRRRGHEVAVLALPPLPAGLLPRTVNVRLANLNQLADVAVLEILSGVDGIVYAAGIDERTVPPEPAWEFFLNGNVVPTERLFRLARKAGVRRAVVLGSYFAYFDRIWPERRLSDKHPYIRSRQEQARRAFEVAGTKLKLCVLELPYIFGSMPGVVPLWEPLVAYVRSPVPLVCTRGGTNMVSVKQVAQAVAGALEHGKGGQCYQIGDENHTWVEILQMLAAIVGRENHNVTVFTRLRLPGSEPNRRLLSGDARQGTGIGCRGAGRPDDHRNLLRSGTFTAGAPLRFWRSARRTEGHRGSLPRTPHNVVLEAVLDTVLRVAESHRLGIVNRRRVRRAALSCPALRLAASTSFPQAPLEHLQRRPSLE